MFRTGHQLRKRLARSSQPLRWKNNSNWWVKLRMKSWRRLLRMCLRTSWRILSQKKNQLQRFLGIRRGAVWMQWVFNFAVSQPNIHTSSLKVELVSMPACARTRALHGKSLQQAIQYHPHDWGCEVQGPQEWHSGSVKNSASETWTNLSIID